MPGDMGIMEPEDHTAECALPRLHDGQCANVPPAPPLAGTADPGYAERLAKLRDRAEAIIKADPAPGSRADCCGSRPVRVRFIDLPPRYEEQAVLSGITATVAVPGGFVLFVDRFRDKAHCDGEQAAWQKFGTGIGARMVVCYPGELDIASWYDAS